MAILDVGQRRYLFEKKQQYLFSYDVTVDHEIPILTEGNLRCRLIGKEDESEVFHVLDDRRVLGNDAVKGRVSSFEETIDVSLNAESALSSGRMIIDVGDGNVLASWDGVVHLGPRYFSTFVVAGTPPLEGERVRAQLSCRFETSNQKYKWLTEQLCASFGTFEMKNGAFVSATFDVYGLA